MPAQYLSEFKNQVIMTIRNGLPIAEASQKYRIAPSTLYRWMKECEQTDTDFSIADYTTLQQKTNGLTIFCRLFVYPPSLMKFLCKGG